ncbi:MAG TPA: TIGR03435 family protein [Acidobacteriaceae bacterium]|nr:TIGR03435 family protein [Acidobacteriaceae bacterium]
MDKFAAALVIALSTACLGGQSAAGAGSSARLPAKLLTWDVVSIHPSDPNLCGKRSDIQFTPDGIKTVCVPLLFLIQDAYEIPEPSRIIGAPEWAKSGGLWNISAKVAAGDVAAYGRLSNEDGDRMRQALLADRFHLKAHLEQRTMPVYKLVVANGGPKLKQATADESGKSQVMIRGAGKIEVVSAGLDSLELLNSEVGRPVVDKTHLTGKYDFTLTYVSAANAASDETGGPSVFTAVEEQLGLKLVPAKAPLDVLVIDSVERPAEN